MAGPPDFYEVLGVARVATSDQIRRAYLQRARRLHPDAGATSSDERAMQRINEAWHVLGDARRRAAYDRQLTGGSATFRAGPAGGAAEAEPVNLADTVPAASLPEDLALRRGGLGDLLVLLPAALLVAALACFAFAVMESHQGLFGFAIMLFLASIVSFLLAPFLALARDRRHR